MRDPGVEEFHSWQDAAKGMLNKIAIAPERDWGGRFCTYYYR